MNQIKKYEDDPWLIKFFKEFETMPVTSKADINWSHDAGFILPSEYLIKDIKEIQSRLKDADVEYLYYVCRHIFNILDWMNLMVFDAGFPTFALAFEDMFEKQFGDKKILQHIYDECFEKWLAQNSGQQKIGENFYNILDNKLYYHNRLNRWFEVDKSTAFDLKPKKEAIDNKTITDQLDKEYKETWYDAIIKQWENKQYLGKLPDDFLKFNKEETTPEEYSDFTVGHIKALLENPVSIAELERWGGGELADIEDIVKISTMINDTVAKRRKENSHTLYLLRDCLVFYEAHKTLDILNSENTSVNQVLIGRKLLSHKSREWAYYIGTLQALYGAHARFPENFDDFYNDYARLLDIFVSVNPGFAAVITELAGYIKKHIQSDKDKITVFDIGFQGSIPLLVKYIIDHHIAPSEPNRKISTDIKVGILALWSKELFEGRYDDDYFPFLNRVQLLARDNDMYHYKLESIHTGEVKVTMGDKDNQHLAAIELVTLVMVALLGQENK